MQVPSSWAHVVPRPPGATPRDGPVTSLRLVNFTPGMGLNGFIANENNPFDPVTETYPTTTTAPSGFTTHNVGYAGILNAEPVGGGPTIPLYCIDLRTSTSAGFGYVLGTWGEAEVPNVGFVARILERYYPQTDLPSGLTANQRAAAVQAAIWYFTDRWVVTSASSAVHSAVAAIVAAVKAEGPVPAPTPPTVTISPSTLSGPAGSVLGPYTVTSSEGDATLHAAGATMYDCAAATASCQISNGTVVASGTQIWLRSTGPPDAVLQATARARIPSGNVFLYDGRTPGVDNAQKLIIAAEREMDATVTARGEFKPPGSLKVEKTITGPAAGHQGEVRIRTVCDEVTLTPDLVIPADSAAGTYSHTYHDIPAGSICTVTAISDGHTSTVTVSITGDGQQVTVPSGGTATAKLKDTYDHAPGSLIVRKLIDGPAAGHQGEIRIHTVCDGTALSPDLVIPAGSAAGTYSHEYTGIPAGAGCTVTETVNGSTSTVTVTPTGSGQKVKVPAGGTATASLTDKADFKPGSLKVIKTITGPAAGLRGDVTIEVVCDGVLQQPVFTIPASSPPGTYSHTYTGIPVNVASGAVCEVTQTADGHTSTVAVTPSGDGQEVTVPPGGSATAKLKDTYEDVSGSLMVNKTITGLAAGHQGEIRIHTVCTIDGVPTPQTPDLVIPAGSKADTYSQEYTGIPPNTDCTVTEISDGGTSTVTVTVTGTPTATVPPKGAAEIDLTDTADFKPGSLTVTKAIGGPAADKQGEVVIHTVCDGTALTPDLIIPAGSPAGSYSHTYTGVPGNSVCTVQVTADGETSTVTVTVTGDGQKVTVPPAGSATAKLKDTYDFVPGSLVLSKTIGGPSAGKQGQVTIDVACTLDGVHSFSGHVVIPAGTPAGTTEHSFTGIPAGSVCTVTETADGATSTITVTVTGSQQQVTVGPGDTVPVDIADLYDDTPGSLTVTKTIAGDAAGKQGEVAILISCGEPAMDFAFLIPAGTAAGSVKQSFNDIPAGSVCTVTETSDGSTSSVSSVVVGSGASAMVPAAGTAFAELTDTYSTITKPPAPPAPVSPVVPPVAVTG